MPRACASLLKGQSGGAKLLRRPQEQMLRCASLPGATCRLCLGCGPTCMGQPVRPLHGSAVVASQQWQAWQMVHLSARQPR